MPYKTVIRLLIVARNPANDFSARLLVEAVGGKLESFYYSFGDFDAVAIAEIPDNVGAAAVSMALSASGAVSSVKTTVLMTPAEAVEALRKSANLGYRPPGA